MWQTHIFIFINAQYFTMFFLLLQGFGDCFKRTAREFICTKILYSFLQWCHRTEQQIREKIFTVTLWKRLSTGLSKRGWPLKIIKKSCQIDKFFKIKTVYIIFKTGVRGVVNIHTLKFTNFCHFLPPEKCNKRQFTATSFTNVQLYKNRVEASLQIFIYKQGLSKHHN